MQGCKTFPVDFCLHSGSGLWAPLCTAADPTCSRETWTRVSLDKSNHLDSWCALADAQLVASPHPSVAPAIIFEVWSYVTQNDPEPMIPLSSPSKCWGSTGQPSLEYTLLNLPAPTSQISSQAGRVRLPPASQCSLQSSSARSSGLKQPSHSARATQAWAEERPPLRLQQTRCPVPIFRWFSRTGHSSINRPQCENTELFQDGGLPRFLCGM